MIEGYKVTMEPSSTLISNKVSIFIALHDCSCKISKLALQFAVSLKTQLNLLWASVAQVWNKGKQRVEVGQTNDENIPLSTSQIESHVPGFVHNSTK